MPHAEETELKIGERNGELFGDGLPGMKLVIIIEWLIVVNHRNISFQACKSEKNATLRTSLHSRENWNIRPPL